MKEIKVKKGLKVCYVPTHAKGDVLHEDVEHGVVSSVKDGTVFVKYDLPGMKVETGNEDITAKATPIENLRTLKVFQDAITREILLGAFEADPEFERKFKGLNDKAI